MKQAIEIIDIDLEKGRNLYGVQLIRSITENS